MKINYLYILALLFFAGCNTSQNGSDAFGNFEAEPVIVSSEATGKVLSFTIDQGQQIEAGELVAIIDTTQLKLKIKQVNAQEAAVESKHSSIQSQIEVYQQQISNLEVDKNRISQMLNDGAATQKQMDDITGQINVVEKQIASANTQFTSVQKELEVLASQKESLNDQFARCFVQNPASGTVLETYAEEGEITAMGKSLYKIADINELTLKVYVSGSMLPAVKLGKEVTVLIDKNKDENQEIKGLVTWISPEAEFTPKIIQTKEERVKLVYAVKVKVKNDGSLKIGMPGEVNF